RALVAAQRVAHALLRGVQRRLLRVDDDVAALLLAEVDLRAPRVDADPLVHDGDVLGEVRRQSIRAGDVHGRGDHAVAVRVDHVLVDPRLRGERAPVDLT